MELPLTEIKELYGLDLTLVAKIKGGYLSDTFEVTDGSKSFFLKRHRHDVEVQVASVCEVEDFFADGNVPVIGAIPTLSGKKYFDAQGRWFSLYPFINGRNIERGVLSPEASRSLGTTLGILHARGKESTLIAPDKFRVWSRERLLRRAAEVEAEIAKEDPLTEFGALARKNMKLKIDWFLKHEEPYGSLMSGTGSLVHGDYFSDNVFFDDKDQVTHVYDFEKADYTSPLYEVFRCMFVSFFSMPTEENLQRAKEYLDAYLKVCKVPIEEVRNGLKIAYLKQMSSVWAEEEHYIKHNTRTDPIFPPQCESNQYLVTNQEHIENILLS